ncbi:MAG: serpin family protein [Candidatus Krumholzibacteria bacterium]|nr:serpin family protein [Candidatus Krumholzibacteria bacterium]
MMRSMLTGIVLMTLLAAAAAQGGCRNAPTPRSAGKPAALPDGAIAGLAGSYNRFGFSLFSELYARGGGTVFVSPASVALCLGMAYNGAGGSTAEGMAQTLRLDPMEPGDFNAASRALLDSLASLDPQIRLDIANSLWLRERFPFRDEFVTVCRESFGAGVFPLTAAEPINAWVSEKTQGMIPTIIESIDGRDIAVLVNAIYFKGRWATPFDPGRTVDGTFRGAGGDQKARMMVRDGEMNYLENDLLQAVRLPYGAGGASMYVLLPREEKGIDSLAAALTVEGWSRWASSMRSRRGRLELPRFKASYFERLNAGLAALGMQEAFTSRADFTRLCECSPGDVFISDVLHKAVIEVTEEGTEAAAATSITMRVTSAMPVDEPFTMIVDRPFILAIVDGETGLILFLGSIAELE